MTCEAQWEPVRDRRGTHTCQLEAGHTGPHHCPTCPSAWDRSRDVGGIVWIRDTATCEDRR